MIEIKKGEGRTGIRLSAEDTGNGLSVLLTGGEKPHVGGVVLAVPRKSLTGAGDSADMYILPVPGHKDTEAAVPVAKRLSVSTGKPVAVTAGIHTEGASKNEIAMILDNCDSAAAALEEQLKRS